jgi:hypothetical protein
LLPDFVKFCKQENIAFTDSERLLFDINLTKRGHRLYSRCLEKTYRLSAGLHRDRLDTYLLDDSEIAKRQLERADDIYRRALDQIHNQQQQQNGKTDVFVTAAAASKIEDLQRITRELQAKKTQLYQMHD